jgi:hypothetical protein
VGERAGDLHAWFTIQQAGWGTKFDFGSSAWSFIVSTLHGGGDFVAIAVVIILVAATGALLVALVWPGWWPLKVYGVIAWVLVVGQAGFFHSKPRLLVPDLLLFVPAAVAAGRARRGAAVGWLIPYAAFGLWFGAYMITIWPYAI